MRSMIATLLAMGWVLACHATTPVLRTHTRTIQPGQLVEGVAFPAGSLVEVVDGTGQVLNVTLGDDAQLQGHWLKKGTQIYLRPAGKLGSVFTVAGQSVEGIAFGEGAQIGFDSQGRIDMAHIEHETRIGKGTYAANQWVNFYPNGRVMDGELARPLDYGPLHAAPGLVAFWPNGRFKQALLAQPATINGIECKAGAISLFASGHIDVCASDHAFEHKIYTCTDGLTLDAFYFADQNVRIDYRGRSYRMDRLPSNGRRTRYADASAEWRPPVGDADDSTGDLVERLPGQRWPQKTECRHRARG